MWCTTRDRLYFSRAVVFSSRRRHTRLHGDWSPDVCSSDPCILWIIRDITIRKEMEKKLLASTQRLIEMEEELRRDIAAEIHDEVGPDLTAIGFNLNIISKLIPVDARNIEENRVKLNDTKELIEHLHRSLRGIMTMLRPPLLDDYGLVSALKWHTERFSQRTRIEVDMQARRSEEH